VTQNASPTDNATPLVQVALPRHERTLLESLLGELCSTRRHVPDARRFRADLGREGRQALGQLQRKDLVTATVDHGLRLTLLGLLALPTAEAQKIAAKCNLILGVLGALYADEKSHGCSPPDIAPRCGLSPDEVSFTMTFLRDASVFTTMSCDQATGFPSKFSIGSRALDIGSLADEMRVVVHSEPPLADDGGDQSAQNGQRAPRPFTHASLAAALRAAHGDVCGIYRRTSRQEWWPYKGKNGQGACTSWAWATFFHCFAHAYPGGSLAERLLTFDCPWHAKEGTAHRRARAAVVDVATARLTAAGVPLDHSKHEALVDFSVHSWTQPGDPTLATCESEMFAAHGVGPGMGAPVSSGKEYDDYTWDVLKLWMVPSGVRLFICRVGPTGYGPGGSRRDTLQQSFDEIAKRFAELLRPSDDAAVVIIPEERHVKWADVRLGIWDRDRAAFEWQMFDDTGGGSSAHGE